MYALRESYPTINSIRRELTMLIGIVLMLIVIANFIIIFGNTHVLHTSNKPIWMYDLFAILFWIINVCSWLATYWDIIKDNSIIHLSFFVTPLILSIWGTIVVSDVKEVIIKSLWHLFLMSYISSIVVSTLFILFIAQEVKRIREEDEQGIATEEHDGVIRGTYRLMTNSGEFLLNQQQHQQQTQPPYPTTRPPAPPHQQHQPQFVRPPPAPNDGYSRIPVQAQLPGYYAQQDQNTYF